MSRTPVGFSMAAGQYHESHAYIICVCDDGSYWSYDRHRDMWMERAPVPGTKRDDEMGEGWERTPW